MGLAEFLLPCSLRKINHSISSAAGDSTCHNSCGNCWKFVLIIPFPGYHPAEWLRARRGCRTEPSTARSDEYSSHCRKAAVRIHFQAWILKTRSIFPTSLGSEIIAKETSATNSAFSFLCWMKHELKMGRWQMMEESSMEKTDHK